MPDLLDRATTVRPGEELHLAKLEPYLRQHFPHESGPLSVRQFPGGHSNLTYALQLGATELVLRRPPFGSKVKTAHDMSREFRVLSKLHSAYPPAPEVLLYCDDLDILGAPFYIMQPIHGIILRKDPPPSLPFSPPIARQLSQSFVETLVHLHSLDFSSIGLADLGKPHGYLERQVRGWTERYFASKTHDFPEVEEIVPWMQQHLPPQSDASLIHNDYKYDNLVLDPADITKIRGVLDWEMCTLGDPLSDLGTALAYWINPDDPEEVLQQRWGPTTYEGSFTRADLAQHYAARTGRDLSNIVFYLVFARFKIAVIIQQIYYRYHQGLTKDERFAIMPTRVQLLLSESWRAAQTNSL
jgi:aminoglycoside phosphotransferase (APT) family kinase protein